MGYKGAKNKMKFKYLFGAVLCCMIMVACQPNEPDTNTSNDKHNNNTETPEGLNNVVDGIGNIIDSKTLEDGTTVMTDDKGNTISEDKDGNITIVTKEGEKILIDNSIKEDTTATKDKWYNSTWKNAVANSPEIGMIYRRKQFVERLKECGFTIDEVNVNIDSTVVDTDNSDEYTLHFKYTTASLHKVSISIQTTYNRTYHLTHYRVMEETIGDGEERYRFAITYDEWTNNYSANLYKDYYYYDGESGSYVYMDSEGIDGVGLEKYNGIYTEEGYDNNSITENVLSKEILTTFFNYRRLNDKQIAASNNSVSYILMEDSDSSSPELEVYDLENNKLMTFVLQSF